MHLGTDLCSQPSLPFYELSDLVILSLRFLSENAVANSEGERCTKDVLRKCPVGLLRAWGHQEEKLGVRACRRATGALGN